MALVRRGIQSFLGDRLLGWWLGLPWESASFTIQDVRIPVGDDVLLAAKVYRTTLQKPHGTILMRTPYGIDGFMAGAGPRLHASRGYHVLHAAVRGTDPSDGCELLPGVHEGADGQATVAWMREQPWYTGSFGMTGGSYVGYTIWAILCDQPEDMKAAVISTAMASMTDFGFRTGALHAHFIAWADFMAAVKQGVATGTDFLKGHDQRLKPVYDGVPLIDAMEQHFEKTGIPDWLCLTVTDAKRESEFFKAMDYSAAVSAATIPILQTSGWNDAMQDIVIEQHKVMAELGRPAHLTIGPWSHIATQRSCVAEHFRFIDEHVGGRRSTTARETPVRVFVTGVNEWRNYSQWPPATSSSRTLHLGPNSGLSEDKPSDESGSSSFTFDPEVPTPAVGLPRPFDDLTPTSYEDGALASREDVAVFTSAPLEADLEVIGTPAIELQHSSDNPHVDLFVRLSEVKPDGESTRISDVYRRLAPDRDDGPIKLKLTDCAHRFKKGMKLRIVVAGGAHPVLIRNLGTGENSGTGTSTMSAVHTIHYSADRPSKLNLPIN